MIAPSQTAHRVRAADRIAPNPVVAAPRAGRGIEQVGQRNGDDQLRLDRAQHRQLTRGQGVVGQLHHGVPELLGAGPVVALRPGGLHDRLQHGLQLLPADCVELQPAGDAAVAVPGQDQPAALGRVGFDPVGVEPLGVEVHRRPQPLH